MSKEMKKTLAFLAVAAVLSGTAAAVAWKSGNATSAADFNDQGEKFCKDFTDPLACTDLEVVEFDSATATARPFKVMFKDNKWIIPSHHNYPADAKDRLSKTAGGVMDLLKDKIVSDRPDDHEALGVIDPLDRKGPLKGRGKRVTLKDKSEKVLAEFIIGNEVRDRPGQRYVRVPLKNRTYGVNVKAELSTKFSDWIETNLLKLDSGRIREVTFDNHKVDPEQLQIIPGDKLTIDRKDSAATWNLSIPIPAGQELNTEKINTLTSALADLKIVGVRPKPAGMSRELKLSTSNEVKPASEEDLRSLVNRGFYPTKNGLYSNQGDVVVKTDEGALYTLRFGEVNFSTGEALEAGGKDEGKTKDAAKKAEGASENRFLMVTVSFDPKLVTEPEKPKDELFIPDDPFWKPDTDPKRAEELKAAKEKADREKADHDKRLADAEKKVKDLSNRFADWYYVTPGDSFRSIELDRTALLKPKDAKPEGAPPGGMPGGFPGGMPGGGGFPGGGFPGGPPGGGG
jgi:Domain of unknown function (DUF4340)